MNKNYILSILLIIALLISSCAMPTNLHIHDRIPHEIRKGFVQFSDEVEKRNTEVIPYVFRLFFYKLEHNYEVEIGNGYLGYQYSPISDRPGKHTYIVKYPVKVITRTTEGIHSKSGRKLHSMVFPLSSSSGFVHQIIEDQNSRISFVDEQDAANKKLELAPDQVAIIVVGIKKFDVDILEDKVTPVKIRYLLEKQNEETPYNYTCEIMEIVVESSRGISTDKTVARFSQYDEPKIYHVAYQEVFSNAEKAAEELGWDILYKNKEQGKLIVKKTRLTANSYIFTVGIYEADNNNTGVSVSSDLSWQRWGSWNTNNSLELINEYYKTIEGLLSQHAMK